MRHSIGRGWRRSLAGGYPDELLQLLRYFADVPDAAALVVKAGLIVAAVYIQQSADRT